jgi:ABC-2 type transport system permease protein
MRGSFAAEILKLRKRPSTWVLLAVSVALTELFAYFLPYSSYLTGDQNQATAGIDPQNVLAGTLPDQLVPNSIGGFPVFAGALALIFGALAVGSEYGWGSMKTILTQRPARLAVYGGKLLAIVSMLLAGVAVTFAAGALTSGVIAAVESKPLDYPAPLDLAQGFAGAWLVLSMWCVLGALLGLVFRSVAVPIGLGVVWVIAVENLVSSVADNLLTSLQGLRDVMPGVNAGSLVGALTRAAGATDGGAPGVTDAVSGTRASITLAIYVAAFLALSLATLRRRDVM